MACTCAECMAIRESMANHLDDEQLRFDCFRALGFGKEYAFQLIWGGM